MNPEKRKQFLCELQTTPTSYSVNYISGCYHNCQYPCQTKLFLIAHKRIENENNFTNIKYDPETIIKLKKELKRKKEKPTFIHLSTMSDFFQMSSDKLTLVPEIKKMSIEILKVLIEKKIKYSVLTKGFYPDEIEKIDTPINNNVYGISIVSLSETFREQFEPNTAIYKKRIETLKNLHLQGYKTFTCIIPYPSPEYDPTAKNIDALLQSISFCKAIMFQRLTYESPSKHCKSLPIFWKNNIKFLQETEEKIKDFCDKKNIKFFTSQKLPLGSPKILNFIMQI